MIQALAAGNAVLAVGPGAPAALQSLTGKGLPLAALDGTLDAADLETLPVDVVAYSGSAEMARAIRIGAGAEGRNDRSACHGSDLSGGLCA